MSQMEVIGWDDEDDEDEVEGDVMGQDIMGYGGPMEEFEGDAEVVGYDEEGMPIVVGARRRRRGRRRRLRIRKPGWRRSTLAPGVIAPDQGMLPLPMGNFTFALAAQTNTFEGQVQKPFRGERWLITTVRTGVSATGRLLANIFVGTDLAQLDVPQLDLEQFGDPGAFGVRLTMKPAQPGVFIRAVTALSNPLLAADTIFASVQLLGRNIH